MSNHNKITCLSGPERARLWPWIPNRCFSNAENTHSEQFYIKKHCSLSQNITFHSPPADCIRLGLQSRSSRPL